MFVQLECRPVLAGRWFGMPGLRLQDQQIVVQSPAGPRHIDVSALVAYPGYIEGVFSARWHLVTEDGPLMLRWLPKQQLARLHQQVTRLLTHQAEQRVAAVHRQFVHQAGHMYLRDSQAPGLGRKIAEVLGLYRYTLPTDKSLPEHTQRTLDKLQQVHPLDAYTATLRQRFEQQQQQQYRDFFAQAEAHPLTSEQQQAVIRCNDRNLVLAAAGTGKTSVMVARALYLMHSRQAQAHEILILAYNSAAATELRERLAERAAGLAANNAAANAPSANAPSAKDQGTEATAGGASPLPTVLTFHALGRQILKHRGHSLQLSALSQDHEALQRWVTDWLRQQFEQSGCVTSEMLPLVCPSETESQPTDYLTLNGEKACNYPHWLIANWLCMQGIEYQYRPDYPHYSNYPGAPPADEPQDRYRPTFFLVRENVYLLYVDPEASEPAIDWQRDVHQQHQTRALEISHQQWPEDRLARALVHQIGAVRSLEQGLSAADIVTRLTEQGLITSAVRRLTRALTVVRAQNLDKQALEARLQKYSSNSAAVWADAIRRLHEAYQQQLDATDSIDFDAMIVQAGELISKQHWQPGYRHILVDEFQDISAPRLQLLQQLLEGGPAPTLTAVGDDWQSIYRFSGSQLTLTTRFEEYFGHHSLTLLQHTFRYNSSIAHTAGLFVMQNPEQYQKQVVSAHQSDTPQVFLLDDQIYSQQDPAQRAKQVVMALRKQHPEAKIAIMARYQFWLTQAKEALRPLSQEHLCYWTFHGAKGLEADYCILLGFNQGKLGFPGASQDDALVEALLPSADAYPYGEERRLCYVAVTRARQSCYIIADPHAPSPFVEELRQPRYQIKTLSERFSQGSRQLPSDLYPCPACEQGSLAPAKGRYGPYYRCTTGPACTVKTRVCPECQSPAVTQQSRSVCLSSDCQFTQPLCPQCGRPLALRSGPNGQFYGCTGYGAKTDPCRFTAAVG